MFEESLRGEAVSMQHAFFLDDVSRLTRPIPRDIPPGLPFFSIPFMDARSHPSLAHMPASLIFNRGFLEQARAWIHFLADPEGSS